MIDATTLRAAVEAVLTRAVETRRDLHRHPETAFEEHRTAGIVRERLAGLGIETRTAAGTGVVGLLRGGRPGRVVALRADMDALPIVEATGAPYASETPGKMHACGHDGHTACLLAAAEVLAGLRGELAGTVKLLFQPAEERGSGAREMIAEGVLLEPDVEGIFALHAWPDLEAGQVGLRAGPMLAAVDTFVIKAQGKGGHGAHPHRCVDPVVIAARTVDALQTLISREQDPLEAAVLTVGSIHGGTAPNIIPDEVVLEGTVRTLGEAARGRAEQSLARVAQGIAAAHGGRAEVTYRRELPATVNDAGATEFLRALGRELLGEPAVVEIPHPSMGGEDFSLYLERVPGAMFRLGIGPGRPGLHASTFDFNDDALPAGILMLAGAAVRFGEGT